MDREKQKEQKDSCRAYTCAWNCQGLPCPTHPTHFPHTCAMKSSRLLIFFSLALRVTLVSMYVSIFL